MPRNRADLIFLPGISPGRCFRAAGLACISGVPASRLVRGFWGAGGGPATGPVDPDPFDPRRPSGSPLPAFAGLVRADPVPPVGGPVPVLEPSRDCFPPPGRVVLLMGLDS